MFYNYDEKILGGMVIFGYARISTFDQNLDLQKDALEKAGCEKLFVDQTSGAKTDRPGLSVSARNKIASGSEYRTVPGSH